MSAVPAPLIVRPPAWSPARDAASRHDPGFARQVLAGLAGPRKSSRVDDLDAAVAFQIPEAARLEALILRCCFRQIAAAAGPDTCVVEIGDAAGTTAALLRTATRRAAYAMQANRSRQLLVLAPDSMGGSAPNEVVQKLRGIAERCASDSLLVVGATLPPPGGRFDAAASIDLSTSYRYSAPRFESLAERAGWQHCQLWIDGQASYAVHVLEQATRGGVLDA